jgi:Glycosyl hydrolase family 26
MRLASLSVSILAVAMLLVPPPPAAGADGAILFGVYPGPRGGRTVQQTLMSLEAQAGHTFSGVRVFDLWDQPFPSSYDTWLRDTGHTLFLSVKARRTNGSVVPWRDIANAPVGSALYDDVADWAASVRDFGAPVYFTFNHEAEASTNNDNGSAADFIAAWRRVITIFDQVGVTNATYVWIATDYAFWRTDGRRADLWYPGDAYVDAVAADAYNWSTCRPGVSTPWRTLEWIADHLRIWGANHPDEELMLTEWASHEDPNVAGRKASWITQAQALFKQPGWEQFTAVLYYHNTLRASCAFPLDSSPSAMAAWLTMSNDPFYGGTPSPPDEQAPSVPGRPHGVSTSPGAIDVGWAASTDDRATTLVYQVYRDGGASPIGSVTSSSTTTVSFSDSGLAAGSVHTYEVTANDGTNTSARSEASDPVTVVEPTAIFSDAFDDGFSAWTGVTGLTVDEAAGAPPPSARAQTNRSRAWAYRTFGESYPSICASVRVSLSSTTDGASLFRLRTTTDGAIVRVFVTAGRALGIRSDVSGAQVTSSTLLPAAGSWTLVELCGTVGTAGSWSLYRDGVLALGPWTANTGSVPVGRITLGTPDPRTITVNFDDVIVDTAPG